MLIVVEGVDGAGKTTLVQMFRQQAKRLCWILSRSGPPKSADDLYQTIDFVDRHSQFDVPLIVDRHPLISESIYGPICRGKSMIEEQWPTDRAFQYIASHASRIIYCRPEMDVIQRTARAEKQMEGVLDNLWTLYQGYDAAMTRLERIGATVVRYDWTESIRTRDLNHLFFGAV